MSILRGDWGEGNPAQVLNCPICDTYLSIPNKGDGGLPSGTYEFHFVIRLTSSTTLPKSERLNEGVFEVEDVKLRKLPNAKYGTLSVKLYAPKKAGGEDIEEWWSAIKTAMPDSEIQSASASRPGYFIRHYLGERGQQKDIDFEIFCPNPSCESHVPWREGMPSGWACGPSPHLSAAGTKPAISRTGYSEGNRACYVPEPFRLGNETIADRLPIPALTVDDQIYHRCPSLIVATVDKFARPAFEPRASALFGNVEYHHCIFGYYRPEEAGSYGRDSKGHFSPSGRGEKRNYVPVPGLDPPDLILQDELHLIEGPLGSLMGLYETAVDYLSSAGGKPVKYIASTATVRQAEEQVLSVFNRTLSTFPPTGLSVNDRFFLRLRKPRLFDDTSPGQLYLGICAPARGPLTPLVRIWARLLQTAGDCASHPRIDPFWTLAGYFNAIRELGGARALFRQDIAERIEKIGLTNPRILRDELAQELSSRTPSTELPLVLDALNVPKQQDALFTTSMFGTGIDIPRLGLMVINGQPKSTSAYIQASGRVGRRSGALVTVFLRASRPRDLDHYEFFCGYHEQLHRFVEPITVMPFAPGALERGLGPALVLALRNRRNDAANWHFDNAAAQMAQLRSNSPNIEELEKLFETRASSQPAARRPAAGYVKDESKSAFDRWQQIAKDHPGLEYVEYAISDLPTSPVVLGDAQHQHAKLPIVYENAPQSLRDIEETCGFQA